MNEPMYPLTSCPIATPKARVLPTEATVPSDLYEYGSLNVRLFLPDRQCHQPHNQPLKVPTEL